MLRIGIYIYYIKVPTDLTDSALSNLEINEMFSTTLLDLAEAEIFYADNRLNRGSIAHKRAMEMIQVYNSRLVIEGKINE